MALLSVGLTLLVVVFTVVLYLLAGAIYRLYPSSPQIPGTEDCRLDFVV